MSYKSLYKLYFVNDSTKFNNIYNERFNSDSTIRFDIFINNQQSFLFYDKEIMSLVAKLHNIDSKINEAFSNLPAIAREQYIRKSLIDEIQFTNQIEGVISTRKEINDLINEIERKSVSHNRFKGIVNKYLLLTQGGIDLYDSKDIRKIYNEMLYDEISEEDSKSLPDGLIFRKEAVYVYKRGDKAIHNGVMPENKIIDYMDKALKILNSDEIDVFIKVSLFHYFFGYIHPFYDGNGRINRFISSYVLSKNFNEIIGYRISMTIKENLTQYLDAFNHTNDIRNKADISTFVYEFLDIIYKSYLKTELYALEKNSELSKYVKIINKVSLLFKEHKNKDDVRSLLYILVQCSIFGDFGLTKSELINILEKGSTKISEYLGILKKYNLCCELKSGKTHYFKGNLEELNKYDEVQNIEY